MAWIFKTRLVIHEQNSIPGTTNKILNKIATKTFQAFDDTFIKNTTTSGNPIVFKPIAKQNNNKLNLLIIGGSLGSKPINEVVIQLNIDINIWHQTGKLHADTVKSQYKNNTVKVTAFIQEMASAYAWADIVLCRAGVQ